MVKASTSSDVLRDAWVATGVAFGLVAAGMLVTFDKGSVLGLVGVLVL